MILALVAAGAILSGAPATATTLSPDGLGRVKIGMTARQAERALGAKLNLTADEDPSGVCLRGSRADGVDPGIIYMALEGTIRRIDVELAMEPSVVTTEGIGRGATPGAVRSTYGARAKHDDSDGAGGDDQVVDSSGRHRGVKFAFEDGKLTWMMAGEYPALSFSEGCV